MSNQQEKHSILALLTDRNVATMFFFGIACGFPLALTASTLKTWLSEFDLNLREIAAFAFIATPYATKFLWSPFIDGIKIPYLCNKLGHRRSWLVVIQTLLIAAILFLGSTNPENNLLITAIAATLVSFLSASQDIVVDAYRIELLPKESQPAGVSFYIYGYRIGLFLAGAVLLVVADKINWHIAYACGAAIMTISVVTTFLSKRTSHQSKDVSKKSYSEHLRDIVVKPFSNFTETKGWQYLIAFTILFKLGDALAGNLTFPFLYKIGFNKTELALIVKTYGLPATLLGAFLGGIIVKKYGFFRSLLFAGIIQMLSNVMFIIQDYYGHNNLLLIATISIENISGGIGDVVFVGYLSSLCNFRFAATQYALLSSIATIGRNLVSGFSGFVVDDYGWTIFFVASIIAAIPGILLILKIKNIKRKQEE